MPAPDPARRPFRVLFVCTGNICRSPLAERVLRARLEARGAGSGTDAVSAGTRALVGSPMEPPAAAIAVREGADPSGHAARQAGGAALEGVDLVLAMTREHRGAVVRERPALVRRAFTLREAARLARAIPPATLDAAGQPAGDGVGEAERWRALVAALGAARGALPAAAAGDDDVVDPYRQAPEVYERCAAQVVPAVDALVEALLR